MTTPSDIEIMLHFHGSATPHPRIHMAVVNDAIQNLVLDQLLEVTDNPDVYQATNRGHAYVQALCAVGYPEQVWVSRTQGLMFINNKTERLPDGL